jgi:hypothetical protein
MYLQVSEHLHESVVAVLEIKFQNVCNLLPERGVTHGMCTNSMPPPLITAPFGSANETVRLGMSNTNPTAWIE